MDILLWLVPPVVVTLVAMAWVGWAERQRPAPDRHEQVRKVGEALSKTASLPRGGVRPVSRDHSRGIAVRRPGAD